MIDPRDIPGHRPDNDREQLAALGEATPATRRNCWTCWHDEIEEDTGCHVCHALGGLGVVDWVEAHVAGNGDVASMPAHDAPPCPGWEPMVEPATVKESLTVRPAPDAPAEEWGRLGRRIPGFRWMPGMRQPAEDGGPGFARCVETVGRGAAEWHGYHGWGGYDDGYPDPDDPTGATEGCLLRLLGLGSGAWVAVTVLDDGTHIVRHSPRWKAGERVEGRGLNLGRACIAAAAAIGRWPGGEG